MANKYGISDEDMQYCKDHFDLHGDDFTRLKYDGINEVMANNQERINRSRRDYEIERLKNENAVLERLLAIAH